MAMVRDWFPDFAGSLVERSGRLDFPPPGSEYWDDFQRALVKTGAHWPEADEACSRVCNHSGLFLPDYRPLILAEIEKVRREKPSDAGSGSVEDARVASRDCPDCLGSGGALRYIHEEILGRMKSANGSDVPVGASFAVPCSCPMGRVFAGSLQQPGRPRPPTVDDYPSLRRVYAEWSTMSDGLDNQFRYRPSRWDIAAGRPIVEHSPDSPSSLRAMCQGVGRKVAAVRPVPTGPAPTEDNIDGFF